MISSGIKRGLAATAISAMAVTGLPLLASSASAAPAATLDVTSRDGAAFDQDEFDYSPTANDPANMGAEESDIVGQINDSTGNPASPGPGRTVNYRWVVTPFDGTPAGTDSGQTQSGTVVADDQGKFSIPRPTTIDQEGTWDLYVSLADDDGPGPNTALAERKALTVKSGDSTLKFDETSPEQATSGTSETVSGSLKLADGTGLAGRSVQVTYNNNGGNANIVQADGTTANSRTVTTDANGNFSVVVQDPAASPQPEEDGTISAQTVNQTETDANNDTAVANPDDTDNPQESAGPQQVQFIQSEAPATITITPDDNGLDRPGETQTYTVNVKSAEGVNLNNQAVTLTIDHGFFTDGVNQGAVGGDFGSYDNDGQTITVTTDGSGNATFNVAIERDAGFDDDGLVTAIIKATAGSVSDTEDQKWTSADPLNGGTVDIKFSPDAEQESGVLPKAPISDVVYFDIYTTDQFGNLVGGENVNITDDTALAGVSDDVVASDFDDNGDFYAFADDEVDQTITATWVTDTEKLAVDGADAGTAPDRADGPDETLTDSETVNWYTVDFANSTFTLTHSGGDTQPVGSVVTETYTATDQFGEEISDLYVTFFRSGPDDLQDGSGNSGGFLGQDGQIKYTYQGAKAGTAVVTAIGRDGGPNEDQVPEAERTDSVTFTSTTPPGSPELTLKGYDSPNGESDILFANARTAAAGAKVTLFKKVNGTFKKIASSTLNSHGNHHFKVKDTNGNRFTKYKAVAAPTARTTSGFGTKRLR